MMKTRSALACLVVVVTVAAGCRANGAEDAARSGSTTESSAKPSTSPTGATKFGTLESPCGPGSATVDGADAGASPNMLSIGVGNDREGIRPGLLKELWDASSAFVKWCNAQGGIEGVPLDAVDLDGKVLEVEAAMATACTDVFALVGGGWAQDNFVFSGKDGSDFHKCRLIAFPGFAVSTDFSEASDQVQSVPNAAYVKDGSSLVALANVYPEEVKKFGVVYGNLPSIIQNKEQVMGVAKQTKGFAGFDEISYDIFNQEWALIAQQVTDKGIKAVSFIGEPPNLSKFSQALLDQGFDGVINADANQYDRRLIESSGPAAVEGVTVRVVSRTFEEADDWPVMQQLMSILDEGTPDWEHAHLAIASFSANLLFATAAKSCAERGPITRECVLRAGQAVREWDAGGLIAPTDPGANRPSDCSMLVQVRNGKFERLFPKLGTTDDNGDGYFCAPLAELTGDFGSGDTDSSILG